MISYNWVKQQCQGVHFKSPVRFPGLWQEVDQEEILGTFTQQDLGGLSRATCLHKFGFPMTHDGQG